MRRAEVRVLNAGDPSNGRVGYPFAPMQVEARLTSLWSGERDAGELLRIVARRSEFVPHFHATYSVGVILRGACAFQCQGVAYVAQQGDVVVIPPYVVHTGSPARGTLDYRMLYLPPARWTRLLGRPTGAPLPRFRAPVMTDADVHARLVDAMARGDANDTRANDVRLARALRGLEARHDIGGMPPEPGPPWLHAHRLKRAIATVSYETLRDRTAFHRMVAASGLDRSVFARQFRRALGLSPTEFLRQRRSELAKSLIEEGVPFAEASDRAGFADQAHMTRVLRAVFGVPPGAMSKP